MGTEIEAAPTEASVEPLAYTWLRNGQEAVDSMLAAIRSATESIRLETFIFQTGEVGDIFRDALIEAQRRGVKVKVMCDAFGSLKLLASYWTGLNEAGGEFRWFNPLNLNLMIYRDHRKILVVDGKVAFIGGFNIGSEYCGDGLTCGWRDLGLRITGSLAGALAETFDDLWRRADCRHRRFQRVRRTGSEAIVNGADWTLLLTGPGRGHRLLKQALIHDFTTANDIAIMSAYFLPNLRILRALKRAARRGARVRLILAGKSDVFLMRIATRGLYPSLLRAGVEIYEYQPQILHAKMVIADEDVYIGSANLDARSLSINYEVLVKIPDPRLASEARAIFDGDLEHCVKIEPHQHRAVKHPVARLLERMAYFILARFDPYIARRQRRHLLRT